MKELVFSIKDIFDSADPNGCLTQYHNSKAYHIPAYQRGYKWGSDDNGAVSVLLKDLWGAFEAAASQQKKEYYLQYITVKPDTQLRHLEVIDGQQRLTTLSILVSVLAALSSSVNYSTGKLLYAIRQDFFTDHIYDPAKLERFVNQKWSELAASPATNKQDIYYLHAAARKIHGFLKSKQADSPALLTDFANYLEQHVKLIVNAVEAHVPSETVFKNLNSNKVPLTETELIKALVITRVGRAGAERRHFKEVMEVRLGFGRLWDELSTWANTPEISTFYFNGASDGMHRLLELVASCLKAGAYQRNEKQPNKELPLFNFYNQYHDIGAVYAALKEVYARLRDWYADTTTYNQMGFCRFAKNSKRNNLLFLQDCLSHQTKSALQGFLLTAKQTLLATPEGVGKLLYGQDDDKIHAVLLALSVFDLGTEKAAVRFNFHAFKTQKWSLEHIFPQSPEGKDNILSEEKKQVVREILGEKLTPEIEELLELKQRDKPQQQLYYNALQSSAFLNSIGNMCLLTGGDNASNGCLSFEDKRRNVLRLVQRGSFVPRHTFDVLSKMMGSLVQHNPLTWTKADIEAHQAYITQFINQ